MIREMNYWVTGLPDRWLNPTALDLASALLFSDWSCVGGQVKR
jgi:hypothetical protein